MYNRQMQPVNGVFAVGTTCQLVVRIAKLFGMSTQSSVEPNKPADEGSNRNSLQGVSRALKLLNALAAAGSEGLSLTEAARQVDTTKSTVLTLLRTMIDFDYVTSFDRGPRYRIGPAVVHLAEAHQESLPWLDVARPVARSLTARCGWTSRIASHIDGHPVFEDRVDAPGVIRFFTPLGIREMPHVSSAGKAILACMSEVEVRRIIAETGLPRRTRNTITDVEVLLRDLAVVNERGYAVDDEEDDEGVFCLAAAFQSRDGTPIGAISVTGLKSEMPSWRVPEFAVMVREAANEIARALGGRMWLPTEVADEEGSGPA
jgi:IclR family acetate operon transcriptional repressor